LLCCISLYMLVSRLLLIVMFCLVFFTDTATTEFYTLSLHDALPISGFDKARMVWNAMIDRRPALIARCRDVDDVIAAVSLAAARGLPMAIRGGGHNVAGHAVCDDGMMIDLSLMRGVTVDAGARVAVVEGGALWSDVDRASQAHGLATPGGVVSQTGVAGLTLSGGIGWLRARYGLSVDNLIAADVVTADGTLVR